MTDRDYDYEHDFGDENDHTIQSSLFETTDGDLINIKYIQKISPINHNKNTGNR
jgi:hypothetical protein